MNKNKIVHVFVIFIFVFLYLCTSIISTIHVIDFFKLTNEKSMAIFLAIAFELGAAASMAAIIVLAKMNKTLVWLLFIVLTSMQAMGNMYHSYVHAHDFQGWIELFGLIEQDIITQKRILSIISGAILPLVALGFIKSLVDYIKPNKTTENKDDIQDKEKIDINIIENKEENQTKKEIQTEKSQIEIPTKNQFWSVTTTNSTEENNDIIENDIKREEDAINKETEEIEEIVDEIEKNEIKEEDSEEILIEEKEELNKEDKIDESEYDELNKEDVIEELEYDKLSEEEKLKFDEQKKLLLADGDSLKPGHPSQNNMIAKKIVNKGLDKYKKNIHEIKEIENSFTRKNKNK